MAKAVKNNQTGSGKKSDSTQTGKRGAAKAAPAKRSTRTTQARQRATQARSGKKQGFKVSRFLRDVRVELGKVTWPTRSELIQSTVVVLVFVAVAAAVIGAYDSVFSRLVQLVLPK